MQWSRIKVHNLTLHLWVNLSQYFLPWLCPRFTSELEAISKFGDINHVQVWRTCAANRWNALLKLLEDSKFNRLQTKINWFVLEIVSLKISDRHLPVFATTKLPNHASDLPHFPSSDSPIRSFLICVWPRPDQVIQVTLFAGSQIIASNTLPSRASPINQFCLDRKLPHVVNTLLHPNSLWTDPHNLLMPCCKIVWMRNDRWWETTDDEKRQTRMNRARLTN